VVLSIVFFGVEATAFTTRGVTVLLTGLSGFFVAVTFLTREGDEAELTLRFSTAFFAPAFFFVVVATLHPP
jgi:hypothetical protein